MTDDIDNILHFLRSARRLQHVYRNTPQVGREKENDAEHSWAVALTCMVLASRLEQEFDVSLDQAKILKMVIIHDLAEIETGDTKTWDSKARIGKEEKERKAMDTLTEMLPSDVRDEILSLWKECEAKETLEAKIVKSIDRSDPVMHRTAFSLGWEGNIEPEYATASAIDARQFPRHSFSKTLTILYEKLRDDAIERGMYKRED